MWLYFWSSLAKEFLIRMHQLKQWSNWLRSCGACLSTIKMRLLNVFVVGLMTTPSGRTL
ncbi:hypothetical protein BDI24065_03586 [Burkholderia diffusa]|uniref:Uncharacterized protein n=1 Tax=Burkholderia diffusa TaxID=488732 RepID=A0A6P2M0L2_9BURK|nr:hypothetical protein BDI24065_03586 [Burkholderia diffusa]